MAEPAWDQREIAEWAEKTFGPAPSLARIAARANEEMAELLRAATSGKTGVIVGEEAADVVIVLYRLAETCGVNLDMLIHQKMQINAGRDWQSDPTGHGYHVRDKES